MPNTRIEALTDELSRNPRRWLVTGAAGFIGSHLVERLLRLGQAVVGLDNFITGKPENLEAIRGSVGEKRALAFHFVKGDIRDAGVCVSACEGVDHVLHQAAIGSVPRSLVDPQTSHEVNVDGFFNMLESTRDAGCSSIVYASSSSVYGDDPRLPKREECVGRPLSPYAATKRSNEVYAAAWASGYGLNVVGLRYFNVVGPRQDPTGQYSAVVPRWIAALQGGVRPTIFGDGQTSRDFCPVENVTQMNILAALQSAGVRGGVFNVALGAQTTLEELYAIIRTEMSRLRPSCSDIDPVYEDFRPGDIRHSQAEISRAIELLGYAPEQTLDASLRATVDWFVRDATRVPRTR